MSGKGHSLEEEEEEEDKEGSGSQMIDNFPKERIDTCETIHSRYLEIKSSLPGNLISSLKIICSSPFDFSFQ